jgi:hypothetical protein
MFEYISVGSPQYNGVVERAFATLYGMVRSMLNAAKVPTHLCHGVWPEAACTTAELKNLLVSYSQTKSPYELFMVFPVIVSHSSKPLVKWLLWRMFKPVVCVPSWLIVANQSCISGQCRIMQRIPIDS